MIGVKKKKPKVMEVVVGYHGNNGKVHSSDAATSPMRQEVLYVASICCEVEDC